MFYSYKKTVDKNDFFDLYIVLLNFYDKSDREITMR